MNVTLLDSMGSDVDVVNAARVSFNKDSEYDVIGIKEHYTEYGDVAGRTHIKVLKSEDAKLISYLAKHHHWSPFSHCYIKFRVKAPIFVARQLQKHTVGLAWNEVSRRYVDYTPELYEPEVWRSKPEGSVKQGSGDKVVDKLTIGGYTGNLKQAIEAHAKHSVWLYEALLSSDVAPEMARAVLPQSAMTEWIWSGSLYAFARVCKLRLDAHAQHETTVVARAIAAYCEQLFPVSWKSLMEN